MHPYVSNKVDAMVNVWGGESLAIFLILLNRLLKNG